MKKNATVKALIFSVMSLILCLSMLVGTTFAWFTDSAETRTNNIVTGTLNVELEYSADPADDSSWVAVDENTELFSALEADGVTENYWEPGHTEVVYLRIRNAGSLALKYHFEINVTRETPFENVFGDRGCRLSDYLVFGQVVSAAPVTYSTREEAQLAVGTTLGMGDYSMESEKLLPGAAEYVTLVVYMPTTVENEANHRVGTPAPTIEFGMTLVAAQTPYEHDSIGDRYDEGADYPGTEVATLEELIRAIAEAEPGDEITLTQDITAGRLLRVNKDIIINGNGHELTGSGEHRGFSISSGADVVIKNAVITGIDSGDTHSAVFENRGNLLVENCILKGNRNEYSAAILETVRNSTQVFRNCLIIQNESDGEGGIFQNYQSPSQTTFEGCIIAGNIDHKGRKSGGAICFRSGGGGVTLIGCILADNDNADFSVYEDYTEISSSNVQIKNCVFGTVYNNRTDILNNAASNGSTRIAGLSILNGDGTLKEIGSSATVVPNVYCFVWSDDLTACTMKVMKASTTGVAIEDHPCTVTTEGSTVTATAAVGGTTYTDTREA